jgi:hypothetical protein
MLHQHRQAYDLWQHPLNDLHTYSNGAEVRAAIHRADTELIPQARGIFTISRNVASRMQKPIVRCMPLRSTILHRMPTVSIPVRRKIFFTSRAGSIR